MLFGTVEYFEKEIANAISNEYSDNLSVDKKLENIYLRLKKDITYDFICSNNFREYCISNLKVAYENMSNFIQVNN